MRLADNRLTGSVPPELGQLIWLRGLDLARNPLSGCLPPSVQVKCDSCPDLPICPSPPRPEAGASACPPQGPSPNLACDKEILLAMRDILWGQRGPQSWQPDTPLQEGFHWGESGGYHPSPNDAGRKFTEGFHGVRVRGNPPRVIGLTMGGAFELEPGPGGTIPPELGRLAWLQTLVLWGSLSGSIPPELGQLSQLQELDLGTTLGANQLTEGPFPPNWGNSASSRSWHLDHNQLTGCLPASWQDRFTVTTSSNGEPQNLPYCPLADLQPEQPEVNQPIIDPDTFVSVSAGMAHACGVRGDDTLVCWGHDHFGQATPPAGTYAAVSAGARHTCGVRSDGTLACWGDNSYGQATPPQGRFAAVNAGSLHTCAVETNGSIGCWGDNAYGQAPSVVPGDYTAVSAGYTHTCAVRADRSLDCWGYDADGRAMPPSGTFSTVSAGRRHNCGLRTDGSVACWGYGYHGERSPPSGTFTTVSARDRYTCGLRTDSTLACWGQSHSGRGSPPSGTFTHVSAGGLHACAVQTDGVAACWGDDAYGQATPPGGRYARARRPMSEFDCAQQADGRVVCGEGTWFDATAAPAGTFADVRVETYHACGLRTDGTVICWGRGCSRTACRSSREWSRSSPPFYVSVGGRNYCALRTDGTIFCWGGSRGLGSRPPAGIFTALSAADHHACGLRTDGSIACWGSDGKRRATPPGGSYVAVSTGALHTCAVRIDQTLICWGDLGLPLPVG